MTVIFFKALEILTTYFIIYRKTQKVKINDIIEMKKQYEKMIIARNFI